MKINKTETFTVSDSIVNFLENKGVKNGFAVIGGAIEAFTNSVAKSNIKEHFPSNENTAAHAAAANYEFSKQAAVVYCTTGPAILNLVNGLACAYSDRKQVFVIVPQDNSKSHDKGALQSSRYGGINTLNIMREVTCYADEVTNKEQLEQKLNLAWFNMTEHNQPVCLSIPSDVLREEYQKINVYGDILFDMEDDFFKELDSNSCIIIGEKCKDILFDIVNFSYFHDIPLIDIPMSRGFLPYDCKNYFGMVGMAGHPEAKNILNNSDKIVFINGEVTETNIGANTEWLNKTILINDMSKILYRGRFINFNLPSKEISKKIKSSLEFQITENFIFIDESTNPMLNLEEQITTPILYDFISKNMPIDTHAFFDSGNSFLFGLHNWKVRKSIDNAEKTFHIGMGQATMFWALPNLIGALAVNPDKHYFCVVGDGAFNMGSNELNLLSKFKSNVVVVVLNDSVMGMAMHGQRISGAEKVGIDNLFTDFSKIAEAHGVKSFIVNNLGCLQNIPLNLKEPILLDVRINPEVVPPIFDRMEALGSCE